MVQPGMRTQGAASSASFAPRTARPTRIHAGNENMVSPTSAAGQVKNARGNAQRPGGPPMSAQSRLPRSAATATTRGSTTALRDITNVTANRSNSSLLKSVKNPYATDSCPAVNAKAPDIPVDAASFVEDAVADEKLASQSITEYVPEIFNLLFREECNSMADPTYMEKQTDINDRMRAILVDWLVEVHMKYNLRYETLFLTVNLIDRFLTRMPVTRKRLQLIGVVALLVAAKFEEIDPPRISDLVYITDNAYKREDIINMECTMLTSLGIQISMPTAAHFLDRLETVNRCDGPQREVVHYLLELALLEFRMVRYSPSHLASAAILVSNELHSRFPVWPQSMVAQSRHSEMSLRECAGELRVLLDGAPRNSLQAVRRKYSMEKHHSVAKKAFGPLILG